MRKDGLVFYDQFSLLSPLQISLVSLGVAVLLIGVWVVSAIQPTGQGGVEVGTWVEDASSCDTSEIDENDAPLLDGTLVEEPVESPDRLIHDEEAIWSPTSPMSPTATARRRHHGPRYGTLMGSMDLGHGVPMPGFSIGLGAASPGFVLRRESLSQGEVTRGRRGRHGRSRSEGMGGLMEGLSGSIEQPDAGENPAESVLRGLEGAIEATPTGGRWWSRLFRRRKEGKIRLEADDGAHR